jgi:hypothetical protein
MECPNKNCKGIDESSVMKYQTMRSVTVIYGPQEMRIGGPPPTGQILLQCPICMWVEATDL